jgi:hypothetical protein
MPIHPWWSNFGKVIAENDLVSGPARDLAQTIGLRNSSAIELVEIRHEEGTNLTALLLNIEVQRPQQLAYPIRRIEPIAVVFGSGDARPAILAVRDDFPDTPHQNWSPIGNPCSLCIDDRPWSETKLTATPVDLLRRIQLWLSKAARGELHDPAQPPDPLFFVSTLGLVLPPSAVAPNSEPVELVGYIRPDNEQFVIARPISEAPVGHIGFVILNFELPPQAMTRLRRAPTTLGQLGAELEPAGIHLMDALKERLQDWAAVTGDKVRRLASRMAIVVSFPTTGAGRTANDVRAFMTFQTAGEIGVAMGILDNNTSGVGAKAGYVRRIVVGPSTAPDLQIVPAQVHFALDRNLASLISGHATPDRRHTVLVGAGSLGSQLALNLCREGRFNWSVVDGDVVLPHNLARHGLLNEALAAPKATALAAQLSHFLAEPVKAFPCDVMHASPYLEKDLTAALAEAELIIDASASVAASRYLSDLPNAKARRVCTFFNPSGTSVVLLVEDQERSITLRDLEAQYHRLIQTEPTLSNHLQADSQGIRYSGSCRTLTNRIPASRAALLSALAARGIRDSLTITGAEIRIWNCNEDGSVTVLRREGWAVHRIKFGDWSVHYDEELLDRLAALRTSRLPNETGGILLGIADMMRREIHVVNALPQPEDSKGSVTDFERGVVGLADALNQAVEASMFQLRYVGEWHSHPDLSSTWPSTTDIAQLFWLQSELEAEGLPALMAIAGQSGQFTWVITPQPPTAAAPQREPQGACNASS